jgi:ornithine cyclodeaminase
MALPYYDAGDIRRLLDYPGCISAVRDAMKSLSASQVAQPLRTIIELETGKAFSVMPGTIPGREHFGSKIISVFADPTYHGRSAHRGIVVLFNDSDGRVVCLADAEEITEIRTAAATAVATDVLAKADARTLAIFGSGPQAKSHIRALRHVRDFEEILIWGRNATTVEDFVRQMKSETGLPIRAEAEARVAAARADVICTVTGATRPVLMGDWVGPGTHVNAVGSSHPGPVEVDHALVLGSRYIVDSRRAALVAAAEFLNAKSAGLIDDSHIVAEIGEVLLGRVEGRTSKQEITLYKSLGNVVQDLAATAYVHSRAKSGQRGLPGQTPGEE